MEMTIEDYSFPAILFCNAERDSSRFVVFNESRG
jgi:hypothetical protein